MRTLTAQQTAALSCAAGYATFGRVLVERSSTWYSLSALFEQELDFLEEVTVSEQMDSPVATAQVRLKRELHGYSLAPLRTDTPANVVAGAYSPLLKEGRRFTVEVAVVPLGMAPGASDWTEVFRGRVDEIDTGGEGLSFSGRDYGGGLMQDTFIESEREYGSSGGVAVQTVMAAILTDNGLSALTFYTPVSPSWNLNKFIQKGEPVADALAALARQRGWEWRWKWLSTGPGTGSYRVWFWGPDRAATTPAWSYGPGEYRELGEVRTALEDVRNAFEGVYSNRAVLDEASNPTRETTTDSDATSITAYGRRFMRIAEAATSNINTSSEMATLLSLAKADLKDVPLGVAVEVQLHPGLELSDLVQLEGNTVQFTANQTAAIQALTHTLNAAGGTTRLTLRGRPSISSRVWLGMEQRPGIAPASPFTGPDAPSNLSTAETVTGFRLRWDPPTVGPGAASYELHVSTTSGFTPSAATRRTTSDTTEFPVTDLIPGTTYYARVVPRDAKGNRGTASSQVTLTPRYVEPRFLQPRVSWGVLPLNGDFEASGDTSKPPDAWTLNAGATWNTHAQTTTDVYSGRQAVHFPNTATTATLTGQPFTVREGEVWVFSAFFKQSTGSTTSGVLAFTYLDSSLTALSSVSVNLGTSATANTWTRAYQKVVIPAGACFGEISFSRSGSYGGTLTVDSVDALRGAAFEAWKLPSYENSWTDANVGTYGQVRYRKNDLGEVELRGVALSPNPAPAGNANVFTLPTGYRPDTVRLWRPLTSGGAGFDLTIDSLGRVRVNSIAAAVNFSFDGVRFSVD